MSKQYNVGLVGVGAVGAEMIKVLKDRNFPCGKVQVFASRERDEVINGETYHVLKAGEDSFNGLKSGRAAGMFVIGLTTTNRKEDIEQLSDVQIADYIGFTFDYLKEIINR